MDLPADKNRPILTAHITSIVPDLEQLKISLTKTNTKNRNANAVIDRGCQELEVSSSSRVSSISSSSSNISSDSNTFGEHNLSEWAYSDDEQEIRELEDEILFESILQAIDLVAPNNVFNRGKSERKRRRKTKKKLKAAITPHLFTIWQNVNDLVFPNEALWVELNFEFAGFGRVLPSGFFNSFG